MNQKSQLRHLLRRPEMAALPAKFQRFRLTMPAALLIALLAAFRLPACADELDALLEQAEREATGQAPADGAQGVVLDLSLTTGDVSLQRATIWDAQIYVTDPAVRVKIEEFVRSAPPDIASISAVVLGEQKAAASIPTLEAALAHKSSYVAESAAYALGLIGNRAAVDALRRNLPPAPGLARWIFEDAIASLSGVAQRPSPNQPTLDGAGVFYFGPPIERLREEWKPMIEKYNLRLDATPAAALNPAMGLYGGAPSAAQFFSLLNDKDDRPQLDVVFISDMMPFEFPYELQWRLFQFARRGGCLVILGESFFMSGKIETPLGRAARVFKYRPEMWDTMIPRPLTGDFKPFAAGIRRASDLKTAARRFGLGCVVHLTSPMRDASRGWAARLDPEHFENILRYAFGGDEAFPALIELQKIPAGLQAGEPLALTIGVFAAGGHDGEIELSLRPSESDVDPAACPPPSAAVIPARMNGRHYARVAASLPTDWTWPDGAYRLTATLRNAAGRASDQAALQIESPLRQAWEFPDFYAEAGGVLTGRVTITNRRSEAIRDAEVWLEAIDGNGRILQRARRPLQLTPGANGPVPLRLEARDYPLDTYRLVCRIVRQGKTLNRSERLLHRAGPYDFGPDLVVVPWGGLDPRASERARRLMEDSGFNGAQTGPNPGWWSWGVTEPDVQLYDTWPGDLIENAAVRGYGKMAEWGALFRDRFPRWGTIDHWDEGQSNVHESDRGDIAPASSAFYRHWLMAKYGALDKLNAAWRDTYATFGPSKQIPMSNKIPPPTPWAGDLSSWNQVWLYRGSPADWSEFADQMWWRALDECHNLFMRANRRRNPWHWHTVSHQRIFATETPGTLSWQLHTDRARYGDRPSTIMLHCIQGEKGEDLYRRFPWTALAGGARHLIVWDVNLAQTGTFGRNPNWTIWNADWTVKWWWKPAAEAIRRARASEQALADAPNALSDRVALLYAGAGAERAPRALFDALYFAGILPDAILPGAGRSEQLDLSTFRVIFRVGQGDLPPAWQSRLDAWQKTGGVLVAADVFPMPDYAGKLMEAEQGIQSWTGSDTIRLMSRKFAEYQRQVLSLLRDKGVEPPAQVLDDHGAPAPHVEPALLTTRDGSQRYLLAACDAGVLGSQAFGKLDEWKFAERVALTDGLTLGAAFKLAGAPATGSNAPPDKRYHVWLHAASDAPVDARVTIDGRGPAKFRDYVDVGWITTDRAANAPRWVAGPVFSLPPGECRMKVETRGNAATIDRAMLVDAPLIQPRMRAPGTKAVYDVYGRRELPRSGDDFLMTMRQGEGEVYALVTEDLAEIAVEPRWIESPGDRRLQLKIEVKRKDGRLSECRHAFNVAARDEAGKPIAGLTAKGSVRGWGVLELFAATRDPPPPWTLVVEDLTSGRTAEVAVAARAGEPFASRAPLPALEFRVEPLPPLDGHVNLVPFRATVVNRGDRPLRGKARVDVPPEYLLDGRAEKPVAVAPGASTTVVWEAALGREQALPMMYPNAPQALLELEDGRALRGAFEDVWILAWDRQPPRFTDIRTGTVDVAVYNYLDRAIKATVSFEPPKGWALQGDPSAILDLPAAPAQATDRPPPHPVFPPVKWTFNVKLDPMAAVSPGAVRLPLTVRVGNRAFAGGTRLVELEKRRTWHVAVRLPMNTVSMNETDPWTPRIPSKPVDAKKDRLWDLEWLPLESDTLLSFPGELGKPVFAVSNARFARAGAISIRVRGREQASVWLGGRQVTCGAEPRRGGWASDELLTELAGETIRVEAGVWLPLVVRFARQTPTPLADLVFLDEQGAQVWDVEVRAEPE